MPRGQGVSLLAATHRPVHSSADSAGHVMGTLGPAARAVAVAGLLSERALQTAHSHATGPSIQRAVLLPRGSRWPRWLRGRAGDRSEALRLLTQCVSTFTPAPRPPFLGDDVTPPPVTRAAFVHRVCSALHKDPGLMM